MRRSLLCINLPEGRRRCEGSMLSCHNTNNNNNDERTHHTKKGKCNDTIGNVDWKASSRGIGDILPKPWWRRRPSVHAKRAATSSTTSSPASSVGVHLFSTFFVTPRELTVTLRRWEKSLEQRQRRRKRRQGLRRGENNYGSHGKRSGKEVGNSTTNSASGISCFGKMPLETLQGLTAEENTEELSSMLATARLFYTSAQRSAAACVDVRAKGRALVRECHGLKTWVCPILLHTASCGRRPQCKAPTSG
ncbi:hypothetical protein C3747_241g24 [Trypanosoma cruzi]|uniref:Uncharacterized protein n=2 Tax=Trypanosoma cruzi TaxID=5693 RepID=Q4DIT0_TRYCC|nr:hypothetical protein, conserved [Trypanosoma cruzi]EAN92436.1 hypothetical protein, conserved [Trypanosoma cruzi]PWU97619.1 hypothetical protein C3747_241g24 [Trypanosoma cruzi]RNC60352.1 hypothetical protein TcCL_ESM01991 [Trypanosoma cruzi]|eukprot:XP_814287.1 hypothetical protein [Trypanosoma cruzi strain CL Brener]